MELSDLNPLPSAGQAYAIKLLQNLRVRGYPPKLEHESEMPVVMQHEGEIRHIVRLANEALKPATANFILQRIELLQRRYYQTAQDEAVEAELAREWVYDLRKYPADIIKLACDRWRNNAKRGFPNDAGVLMESVQGIFSVRRVLANRGERVIALIDKYHATPHEGFITKEQHSAIGRMQPKNIIPPEKLYDPKRQAVLHEKRMADVKALLK